MFMLPGDQEIHELNFRWIVILYSEDDICIWKLINSPTFGEKKLLFDVFYCHEFLPRAFEKAFVAQLAAK